jgi:dihydropyrimidinase
MCSVLKGRIDVNSFVALTSTNVAKIYGLYPRKGTIAIGTDADLTIWNDKLRLKIENRMLHHAVDYTPYEGIELSAWPETTISRGEVVWSRPDFKATQGRGQFLRCDRPTPARARRRAETGLRWLTV